MPVPRSSDDPRLPPLARSLGIAVLLTGGCDVAGKDGCTPGTEGCECVESQCNPELVCGGADVCIDPSDADADADAEDPDDDDDDGPSEGSDEGPPEILAIEVNVDGLASGSPGAQFVVQVTDPDGLGDLVGGTIRAPNDEHLATFDQLSGGSFAAGLGWSAVANAGLGHGLPVELRVVFVDASGGEGVELVPLVVCGHGENRLCDGTCIDGETDPENCGDCGNVCNEGENCEYGFCYSDDDYDYGAPAEDETPDCDPALPVPVPGADVPLFLTGAAPLAPAALDVAAFDLPPVVGR